jgi:BirA family biotin operon repressor/biotin-[acetyl-CoA-carboxylase] ligase
LDPYLIERDLGTRRVGRNVICFDQVDSTNDVAFASAPQTGSDGLAIFAESQRKGRGRLGRQWISPPRANMLMSVLLTENRDAPLFPAGEKGDRHPLGEPVPFFHEPLTIAAGLAVAQAIEQSLGVTCGLKWPNDVLIDGQKVAGILVEVRKRGRGKPGALVAQAFEPVPAQMPRAPAVRAQPGKAVLPDIVIGIGINVHASPPGSRVDLPATDLAEHTGGAIDRIELARAVLKRLDHWIDLVARGKLLALHKQWMARCDMINQRITVGHAGGTHTGRVLDIDPLRGLVLCDDHGRSIHLPAQTATILK